MLGILIVYVMFVSSTGLPKDQNSHSISFSSELRIPLGNEVVMFQPSKTSSVTPTESGKFDSFTSMIRVTITLELALAVSGSSLITVTDGCIIVVVVVVVLEVLDEVVDVLLVVVEVVLVDVVVRGVTYSAAIMKLMLAYPVFKRIK